MWAIRQKVNLLLDHGHPDAWLLPLGTANDEATLIERRINRQSTTEAVLFQAAASSIMAKEGGEHFKALIERLSGE